MNQKKHKLSVSIEEDYCLIGILSDEPDYKLCWLVNEKLKYSFKKTDDLLLYNKKLDEDQSFSIFHYYDDSTMLHYRLIVNRTENGYFVPDIKNIDYLIHIQGDLVHDDLLDFIKRMNTVNSIRMCVPVDLKRIKERDRLQLW